MVDVEMAIRTAQSSSVAKLPFAVLALGLSALATEEPPALGIARGQRCLALLAEDASGLAGSVFTLAAGLLVAPESLGVVLGAEGEPTPEALVRTVHRAVEEAAAWADAGRIDAAELAQLFRGAERLGREAMAPEASLPEPPPPVAHLLAVLAEVRRVGEGLCG